MNPQERIQRLKCLIGDHQKILKSFEVITKEVGLAVNDVPHGSRAVTFNSTKWSCDCGATGEDLILVDNKQTKEPSHV